jgi:hypothetical protein
MLKYFLSLPLVASFANARGVEYLSVEITDGTVASAFFLNNDIDMVANMKTEERLW